MKLNNIYNQKFGSVWVKMEEFNPAGSIKSGVGRHMIADAEQKRILRRGSKIIEPTGGNTVSGLALSSALKGYDLTLVVPDNCSEAKVKILKQYGATVLRSDHRVGSGSHIRMVNEILNNNKDNYIFIDQFSNQANPQTHYHSVYKKGFYSHAKLISENAKIKTGIEIHPACTIGKRFVLDHGIGTVIGETCHIGDDCYILQSVILGSSKIANNKNGKHHPSIGNPVQPGRFVTIVGDITIGNNVKISSHTTVKKSIPANTKIINTSNYAEIKHDNI